MAFNKLEVLGPIPCGRFDYLEELDIGENPISSWEEICHLGSLPRFVAITVIHLTHNVNRSLYRFVLKFPHMKKIS